MLEHEISEDRIPWQSISPHALEELVYTLLHAMEPRSIEWRSNESGITTSDGGRDIQAIYEIPTPDGDTDRQTWWIECKRRKGTVKPEDVKSVVQNTLAYRNVDVLIIATNSSFSNPTKDWIDNFNEVHKRPLVRLWDSRRLESLIQRYPTAVAQNWPSLLSFDERADLAEIQFFNNGRLLTELDLEFFWKAANISERPGLLVAAAYSELFLGGFDRRPWVAHIKSEAAAITTLAVAFVSLPIASIRHVRLNQDTAIRTAILILFRSSLLADALLLSYTLKHPDQILNQSLDRPSSDVPYNSIVRPAIAHAFKQLADSCSDDCARVSIDPPMTVPPPLTKGRLWKVLGANNSAIHAEDARTFVVQYHGVPCAVGFDVCEEIGCPLLEEDPQATPQFVETIKRVIEFRRENPKGQFAKYSRSVPIFQEINERFEGMLNDLGVPRLSPEE